jgi:hypothetical protein
MVMFGSVSLSSARIAFTIIALTTRLLASAKDPNVIRKGYTLLRNARGVAFGWMRQLTEKLQASDWPARTKL